MHQRAMSVLSIIKLLFSKLSAGLTGRRPSFLQPDDATGDSGGKRRLSKSRRPSFCKTDTFSESKSNISLLTGLPPGGKLLSVEHTWNPVEASFQAKERKVSTNVIDKRYGINSFESWSGIWGFIAFP